MGSYGRLLNRQQGGGRARSRETQEMGLQEEERSAARAAQISSEMRDSKGPRETAPRLQAGDWGDLLVCSEEIFSQRILKCQWSFLENAAIFQTKTEELSSGSLQGRIWGRGLLQGPFSPVSSLPVQGPASFVEPLRSQMISTVTRGRRTGQAENVFWTWDSGSSLSPVVPSQSCITLSENGIWRVTKDAMFYIPSSAFRSNIPICRHILPESRCL